VAGKVTGTGGLPPTPSVAVSTRAGATAGTAPAGNMPTDITTDLAADLRAGRITAKAALDKVIDRVVDRQVGVNAPAAVREQVRTALAEVVAGDPLLGAKLNQL
jgi:hypothetical protein